jgi:ABC-type Fe3+/spermidine/putrescine transport system ATPase subunit
MLRPERLTATTASRDDGRSIEATVADVVFQGATARIVVHLKDHSEVIASVVTGTDLPFLHPGATVHLSWEPGSAFLLSDWPTRAGATASDIDTLEKHADS